MMNTPKLGRLADSQLAQALPRSKKSGAEHRFHRFIAALV
jgi:hypothetical protein